ncbi:MAG: DUF512 domain-containing protein [Lachnospiraceae bacterium]
MKKKGHLISGVKEGSIAEELEITAGDVLLQINDMDIEDIFDYQFFADDEELSLLIRKADGQEWLLEIEKDYGEDIGLVFENGLMDQYRSCTNHCIFCFIDQMPPGMRETLYFKDDDARLSFLQGNYITLTNLKQKDLDRIVRYHLSPINISVHTTNPELRRKMLHNRFAGEVLDKLDFLYEHGITMNGQIVLCKDWNDGAELERTLRDLKAYCPVMQSLSIVPIGMTKYREGLCQIEPFDQEDACRVIDLVEHVQQECFAQTGLHFVHASDELYLLAGRELPEEERYDGYLQLENGVGMLRLLMEETARAVEAARDDRDLKDSITIATGKLAYPYLVRCCGMIRERFPGLEIQVVPIENHFFGEMITVSGLITGQDLKAQLAGLVHGSRILIPSNMLRSGEETFLDDLTVTDLSEELGLPIVPVQTGGISLVCEVTGQYDIRERLKAEEEDELYRPYEPGALLTGEEDDAEEFALVYAYEGDEVPEDCAGVYEIRDNEDPVD